MQREGAGGSAGGVLLYSLELEGAKAKGEPGERAQAGRAVKVGDMAEVEGRAELPGGGEDEFPKPGSNRWVKFSGRGSEIKRNWKVNIPLPFFSRGKAGEESNESKQGRFTSTECGFLCLPGSISAAGGVGKGQETEDRETGDNGNG